MKDEQKRLQLTGSQTLIKNFVVLMKVKKEKCSD